MHFSRKNLGIPYAVFLTVFVIAPLLVLLFYAFTNGQGQFTMQNLTGFFTDPNALGTLFYSLLIAAVTTLVCLLLAYPVAYILGTSRLKSRSVIIMLFVILCWRIMIIATNAPDLFGGMIATGVMVHIAVQVILNIAVVTNTIPNTGISLPFISYGGSSVMFLLAEIGMVISVSREIRLKEIGKS